MGLGFRPRVGADAQGDPASILLDLAHRRGQVNPGPLRPMLVDLPRDEEGRGLGPQPNAVLLLGDDEVPEAAGRADVEEDVQERDDGRRLGDHRRAQDIEHGPRLLEPDGRVDPRLEGHRVPLARPRGRLRGLQVHSRLQPLEDLCGTAQLPLNVPWEPVEGIDEVGEVVSAVGGVDDRATVAGCVPGLEHLKPELLDHKPPAVRLHGPVGEPLASQLDHIVAGNVRRVQRRVPVLRSPARRVRRLQNAHGEPVVGCKVVGGRHACVPAPDDGHVARHDAHIFLFLRRRRRRR
mmetsp:Transcript_26741/g.64804  ORF Transcript_26741/g.64804 Transcript_26741/m.64804 type:complete len:293 (-) Transcript_26741:7-885(-)